MFAARFAGGNGRRLGILPCRAMTPSYMSQGKSLWRRSLGSGLKPAGAMS